MYEIFRDTLIFQITSLFIGGIFRVELTTTAVFESIVREIFEVLTTAQMLMPVVNRTKALKLP